MHRMTQLYLDPKIDFDAVVGSKSGKHRVSLDASKLRVLRRYEMLEQNFTPPLIGGLKAARWKASEKKALLHCYEVEVMALRDLKGLIRLSQSKSIRSICPYCGIGVPRQFDHYLPKSEFPEFAVHSHNLIPCCGSCNGIKGEIWLVNGARTVVNFYIDSLPETPILQPDISWKSYNGELLPAISFQLVKPAGFSVGEFQLIERHFNRLKLLKRYKDEAGSVFDVFRDTALAREASSIKVLRKFLSKYIERRERKLGPLSWKLALYKELLEHEPFLQECLA